MATIGTPFAFSAYAARNRFAAAFAIGTGATAFCPVVATTASALYYLATIAAMDTLATIILTFLAIGTHIVRIKIFPAMFAIGALAASVVCATLAAVANRSNFFGAIRAGNTVARIAILACAAILASLFTLAL